MLFSRTIRLKKTLILIGLLTGWGVTHAQTNAVSPLTVFGLGDLSEGYFAQNFGIGGTSMAIREPLYINIANPASYSALEYTSLEVAVSQRFVKQTVDANNQTLNNQSSYFNYFALGFKLKDWWGMSASLSPYSFVGYSIFTQDSLAGFGDILYEFQGKGGINQAVFGNSFEIFKNFSLGINARYLFGTYDRSNAVLFSNGQYYNSKRLQTNGINSFAFDYGLQYQIPLKNNLEMVFGATYANQIDLNAVQSALDYSFIYNNSGTEVPVDTLSASIDQKGKISLPTRYGAGLSIGKKHLDLQSYAWMLNGEFTSTLWSNYKNFNGDNDGLQDAWRVSVGAHFTPKFAFTKQKFKSYFSTIEYRLGGFYEQTQLSLDNLPVLNYGLTAGFGLPIAFRGLAPGEKKSTVINFGIVVGNRGNGQPDQLNERYVNLIVGLTLGDQWFQKFKYR